MAKYSRFKESQYGFDKDINFYSTCLNCDRCGHSIYVLDNKKAFCKFCGRYVFKNKKDEFEYRLKENSLRLKRK